VLILIVTAVAIVGTLLVARNRFRAALGLLLGTAVTFVIVRALANKVLDDLPGVARTPAGQAALAAATSSLADSLVKSLGVLAVLCLVGALLVYALDSDSALRRRIATRTGSPSLRSAVAAYRVPVAIVAGAGALLVITIGGFGIVSLIVAVLLAALAVFALVAPAGAPTDVPAETTPAPSADGTVS